MAARVREGGGSAGCCDVGVHVRGAEDSRQDRRHRVTAVFGDSPYTASFARFLSEGVSRWAPAADQHAGIVFALPHRHAIVFKTCGDAQQTRDALDLVPMHADSLHTEELSPVSPHVYHWYNRQISCLTTQNEDGSLTLRTTPVLESMLGARRQAG